MKVTAIGVDLAKNLIQLHGADAHGKAVLKKQLKRTQVLSFFANLPPCVIGMEACAGAHHWARKLESFGHRVKLMAPRFVNPTSRRTRTIRPHGRRPPSGSSGVLEVVRACCECG